MRLPVPQSKLFVPRRGFTLVEMLVAITIFAILATIAIGAFSEVGSDRVPAAARQLRGMIAGAQSRAAKDRAARGLRLLLDTNLTTDDDNFLVTSLSYVGANTDIEGELDDQPLPVSGPNPARQVKLLPRDIGWRIKQVPGETVNWTDLFDDGNVRLGDRVYLQWTTNREIESQERLFYISDIGDDAGAKFFLLAGPEPPPSLTGNIRYRLELAPEILPNSEPVSLPRGSVIDLNASRLPTNVFATLSTNGYVDILFSPRGEIQGTLAGEGMVHFYVGMLEDSQNDRVVNPMETTRIINTDVVNPQRVVSLIPATGQVLPANYAPDIAYSMTTPHGPFTLAVQGREAK